MQSGVDTTFPQRVQRRNGFEETELERRGIKFNFEAPVTGAVSLGAVVAVVLVTGKYAFFVPVSRIRLFQQYGGVVLCMTADGQSILTGGDDGKF